MNRHAGRTALAEQAGAARPACALPEALVQRFVGINTDFRQIPIGPP